MSRSPAQQLAQLLDRSLTLHSVRELPLADLIVLDALLEQWHLLVRNLRDTRVRTHLVDRDPAVSP